MQTIPLILLTSIKGLPAGSKGRGFIGKTRAVFVPEGVNTMYVFSSTELVGPDPAPELPPPAKATPAQGAPSRWRSAGEILSLMGLFPLLGGCHPVDELRAAFGFGALFGVFVAVVVAAFIVRQREQAEGLDVSRALGAPGPRIRDALRR